MHCRQVRTGTEDSLRQLREGGHVGAADRHWAGPPLGQRRARLHQPVHNQPRHGQTEPVGLPARPPRPSPPRRASPPRYSARCGPADPCPASPMLLTSATLGSHRHAGPTINRHITSHTITAPRGPRNCESRHQPRNSRSTTGSGAHFGISSSAWDRWGLCDCWVSNSSMEIGANERVGSDRPRIRR